MENQDKPALQRTRILVVDDEKVIRDLFTRVLGAQDVQVTTVGSGEEAVDKIRKEPFDVVFLDMVMPGMDGLETFKVLKQIKPEIATVMMTGFAVEHKIKEALSLDAFDYLYKPFDVSEIMATLKKAAKRKYLKPVGRIVLADNSLDTCETLRDLLVYEGYQVFIALDGQEALFKVKDKKPNLVLSNISLPDTDGIEILQKIREIDDEIRVIFLIGLADEEKAKQAMKLGAYDCVTEPIDHNYLKNSVLIGVLGSVSKDI